MYAAVVNPPMGLPAFKLACRDWEVIPIRDGNEIIGAIIRKFRELHVGVKRRPAGAHRALVRSVLVETIERYGFAETTVRTWNTSGIKFCRRMGFKIEDVSVSDGMTYLRCEQAAHSR